MTETTKVPAKRTEPMVTRWNPFERLAQMQAEFDRFFNDARNPLAMGTRGADWVPRTDVFEQNGNLVVKAELPGMKKEDIDIAFEAGDLIIQGKREEEQKVDEKYYHRMERTFGSFYRRLPMPEGVMPDEVKATYGDGILEVKVPKPTPVKPEPAKIPIK